MIVAGIDPGVTGALALINIENGRLSMLDVPIIVGKPNYALWASTWCEALATADHVWVERVGARPGQGVSSMFTFGERFGFVIGLVCAAGRPHTFTTPQAWKRSANIPSKSRGGAGKARIRAAQLFPDCASLFARVKDDGRADATLIAFTGHHTRTAK